MARKEKKKSKDTEPTADDYYSEWSHGGYTGKTTYPKCNHTNGSMAIETPGGVYLGGSASHVSEKFDADFVVDMNGHYPMERKPILSGSKSLLSKLAEFISPSENHKQPKVLKVSCADFAAPSVSPKMWNKLVSLFPKGSKVLVTCVGGHGRTGTAMASILVASGVSGAKAINFVREHYCDLAIETVAQEDYVLKVYRERLMAEGMNEKEAHAKAQGEIKKITSSKAKSTVTPSYTGPTTHKDFKWGNIFKPVCPDCKEEAETVFLEYIDKAGSIMLYKHAKCGLQEAWIRNYGSIIRQVPIKGDQYVKKDTL